jgi:prepilin-type N-terminal cleavage/methylation domain-containing protein
MKIHPLNDSARRHGFTLVELLVVIAIIAVLAGAGFAGAKAAIEKAQKTKAKHVCTTINTAVLTFYDEYGHLPLPTGASGGGSQDIEIQTVGAQGVDLLTALMGMESDSDNMLSPKKIRFLDIPEGKRTGNTGKNGIIYNSGNSIQGLYDPWGQPYRILMDANYDDNLDNNPFSSGNSILRGRRVGAYTYGKNKRNDQGGQDDVKSW